MYIKRKEERTIAFSVRYTIFPRYFGPLCLLRFTQSSPLCFSFIESRCTSSLAFTWDNCATILPTIIFSLFPIQHDLTASKSSDQGTLLFRLYAELKYSRCAINDLTMTFIPLLVNRHEREIHFFTAFGKQRAERGPPSSSVCSASRKSIHSVRVDTEENPSARLKSSKLKLNALWTQCPRPTSLLFFNIALANASSSAARQANGRFRTKSSGIFNARVA